MILVCIYVIYIIRKLSKKKDELFINIIIENYLDYFYRNYLGHQINDPSIQLYVYMHTIAKNNALKFISITKIYICIWIWKFYI